MCTNYQRILDVFNSVEVKTYPISGNFYGPSGCLARLKRSIEWWSRLHSGTASSTPTSSPTRTHATFSRSPSSCWTPHCTTRRWRTSRLQSSSYRWTGARALDDFFIIPVFEEAVIQWCGLNVMRLLQGHQWWRWPPARVARIALWQHQNGAVQDPGGWRQWPDAHLLQSGQRRMAVETGRTVRWLRLL